MISALDVAKKERELRSVNRSTRATETRRTGPQSRSLIETTKLAHSVSDRWVAAKGVELVPAATFPTLVNCLFAPVNYSFGT